MICFTHRTVNHKTIAALIVSLFALRLRVQKSRLTLCIVRYSELDSLFTNYSISYLNIDTVFRLRYCLYCIYIYQTEMRIFTVFYTLHWRYYLKRNYYIYIYTHTVFCVIVWSVCTQYIVTCVFVCVFILHIKKQIAIGFDFFSSQYNTYCVYIAGPKRVFLIATATITILNIKYAYRRYWQTCD